MSARGRAGTALRRGFTTGACAAAAAQAATVALVTQKMVDQIELDLPQGDRVEFIISNCSFDRHQASCSVIKDAGDDPDVTDGAEVCATISWKPAPGIHIKGGKGVGLVTKPGLEVAIGRPAINPVPQQMIVESIRKAAGAGLDGRGIEVVISVPQGEEMAQKTLNSRLGIVGGISILGTTGIVIPYSTAAYKACISQALDVAVACGCQEVVLTTGRRSEKFAQSQLRALDEECFIQSGDFIGFSLRQCATRRLSKVTIWGMIGKMSKLAAGHFYTNVSDSRVNIGFLARLAADCGIPDKIVNSLEPAVTANHFRRMLPSEYLTVFCNRLCRRAAERCREKTGHRLNIQCIISNSEGVILGRADAGG